MKKILLPITALLLSAGIAQAQINDANAEVRIISSFHAIQVSSAFNVYLSQSNEDAVAVSADETKYRDRIKTEVKDGVLRIWYDNDGSRNRGNKKLKAYISFKQIDMLTSSGACDVFITGTLKLESLSVTQSGASDLKGKMDIGKLMVDISGASDMTVSGTVNSLFVAASGASDFKGYDLVTETCDVRASGASDIKVTVNKELSAQASGASDVRYRGNGIIRELKSSGSSSVSKG